MTTPTGLPDALQQLRDAVAVAPLGLATTGRDDAARAARAVVDQIDDYLLPRLRDLDAPLLTVVGGSTGAGKSTLVNSLLGLARTTGEGGVSSGLRLVVAEELPPGLAVLDAPDVDSVVDSNRELAGQLL